MEIRRKGENRREKFPGDEHQRQEIGDVRQAPNRGGLKVSILVYVFVLFEVHVFIYEIYF